VLLWRAVPCYDGNPNGNEMPVSIQLSNRSR